MNKKMDRNDLNPKNDISKKIEKLHKQIDNEGLPEIGLLAKKMDEKLPSLKRGLCKKDSEIDFASEVESAASMAYAKKTSLGQDDLRNEYHVALNIMKKTGKPPITID